MVKLKYIIQAISKSYSHKPHLQDLPYDLRSTNPDELQERIDAIDERLKKEEEELQEKYDSNLKLNDEIRNLGDENEKLKNENRKIKGENNKYSIINKKWNAHFDKVKKNQIKDAKNIKEDYEKLKKASDDTDFSDLDFEMDTLVNKLSKYPYLPVYYADEKTKPLQGVNYIEERLNPMINTIQKMNTPESKQVATKLEDYRDKYNMNGDTPYTKEYEKLESQESDTWYITYSANKTKINKNNKQIVQNSNLIDKKVNELKNNSKDIKLAESRVEDYKEQKEKTEQRKAEVENNS